MIPHQPAIFMLASWVSGSLNHNGSRKQASFLSWCQRQKKKKEERKICAEEKKKKPQAKGQCHWVLNGLAAT